MDDKKDNLKWRILSGAGEASLCLGGFVVAGSHGPTLTPLNREETVEAHNDMMSIAEALNLVCNEHPDIYEKLVNTFTNTRKSNYE